MQSFDFKMAQRVLANSKLNGLDYHHTLFTKPMGNKLADKEKRLHIYGIVDISTSFSSAGDRI